MIASRLLGSFGLFDRAVGPVILDCDACEADDARRMCADIPGPSRRDLLGCGRFPVHPHTGELIDLGSFLAANPDSPAAAVQDRYAFANLGFVRDLFGWAWPWCPRWFSAFAADSDALRAASILRRLPWVERGAISYDSITVEEINLVDQAIALRSKLEANERERQAAKSRAKR